jgi:hypothetical protein
MENAGERKEVRRKGPAENEARYNENVRRGPSHR